MADRRITVQHLSLQLYSTEASVCRIMKVCGQWVPRQLTDSHKVQYKNISSELLACLRLT